MAEMNTVAITGFRANSWENILLGPGAVVLNYGSEDPEKPERILGVTNGGNSFNPGVTFRDIEVDQPFGLTKNWRVVDDIRPTITTNLKEIGVDNLRIAIPGLVEVPAETGDTHTVLRMGSMKEEHYLDNVAIIATILGSNRPFIGIIYGAIAGGEIEISLENKNEPTVELTFTGTFDPQDIEDLVLGDATLEEISPFEVRYPLPEEGS